MIDKEILVKSTKRIVFDITYIIMNYIVTNVPSWTIRKLIYRGFGMKIGSNSRINMKCIVIAPWNIVIGRNTIINEFVYLDGRGGLSIGDFCSISIRSVLFSSTHHVNSSTFEYYKQKTIIGNGVWVGTQAVINAGTKLENEVIIGANSVTSKTTQYKECGVYSGIPATHRYNRNCNGIVFETKEYFR